MSPRPSQRITRWAHSGWLCPWRSSSSTCVFVATDLWCIGRRSPGGLSRDWPAPPTLWLRLRRSIRPAKLWLHLGLRFGPASRYKSL